MLGAPENCGAAIFQLTDCSSIGAPETDFTEAGARLLAFSRAVPSYTEASPVKFREQGNMALNSLGTWEQKENNGAGTLEQSYLFDDILWKQETLKSIPKGLDSNKSIF